MKILFQTLFFIKKKFMIFLKSNAKYNEEKRDEFFSPTASTRQVKEAVHQKSIKKE